MQAPGTWIPIDLVARVPHRGPQPLRFGVPFAPGRLPAVRDLALATEDGRPLPIHAECASRWPDGSVRWASIDLLADLEGRLLRQLRLRVVEPTDEPRTVPAPLEPETDQAGHLRIRAGEAIVLVRPDPLAPIDRVDWRGRPALRGASIRIAGRDGEWRVDGAGSITSRSVGRQRFEVEIETTLSGPGRRRLEIRSRLTIFGGAGLMRWELRLRNPARARHRGGLWDLGDAGSVVLDEVAVRLAFPEDPGARIVWRPTPDDATRWAAAPGLRIHQESSGGENWRFATHLDRHGRVPLRFRGAEILDGAEIRHLHRPSPIVARIGSDVAVAVAIPRFWEEFPRRLEATAEAFRVALFPSEHGTDLELQGGEQKTHTVWFAVSAGGTGGPPSELGLEFVHGPACTVLPPSHVAASRVVPGLVVEDRDPSPGYVRLARRAIDGPGSFVARREATDEYGWRHFGETWADHEDPFFPGDGPVVSHYNNQYDLVFGFLLHFLRSGEPRWRELATALARHVMDIDRYHTREDRAAYNGGLFWHTEHYLPAGRGTHRSYSRDAHARRELRRAGGGPANEHNYTSGLLLLHELTGDPDAAEAVLGLADWVVAMDDGSDSILAAIDGGPTGKASATRDPDYHGPGRGAGNSVNALLDAWRLSGERRYLEFAETLIRRCSHPDDDPDALDLLDVENRWSYTVFLQALGKYLELKHERRDHDAAFDHGRAVLQRYAEWMAGSERPFADYRDQVEYATESWPAQDLRKSAVFDLAARFARPEHRDRYLERAEFFHRASVDGIAAFGSTPETRTLAVVLATGAQRPGREWGVPADLPPWPRRPFSARERFVSQKRRVLERARTPVGLALLLSLPLRPRVLARLLRGRTW